MASAYRQKVDDIVPDAAPPARGPYDQLRPIAASLGVPFAGAPAMSFTYRRVRVTISLQIDSGLVRGLELAASRDDLPEMVLRRETEADTAAKKRGMNVELQTGDVEFDRRVYVESDLPAEAMRPLFAAAPARQATMVLLRGFSEVSVHRSALRVTTRSGPLDRGYEKLYEPKTFQPYLDAFLELATAPTLAEASRHAAKPRGHYLAIFSVLGVLAFGPLLGFAIAGYPVLDALLYLYAGLVGLALHVVTLPIVRRYMRGHSRSAYHYKAYWTANLLAMPGMFMASAPFINGAFDPSPPQVRVGRIERAVQSTEGGEASVEIAIVWDDGSRSVHEIDESPEAYREGGAVRRVLRRGALGYTWTDEALAPVRDESAEHP